MRLNRSLSLLAYYGFARFLPTQPAPGWRFAYKLRRLLVAQIFDACGDDVIVKHGAYFGNGKGIKLGHRAQIGHNARIDHSVEIGDDVLMGPDVVIMTVGHAFQDPLQRINLQGGLPRRPLRIGRDAWIGTRVIILPGVEIGEGAVVGAGAVVTKSVPPFAVVAGNPARVIRWRGREPEAGSTRVDR